MNLALGESMEKRVKKSKKSFRAVLLLAMLFISALVFGASRNRIDRSTIKSLDLKSYMGRWHELARFDHSFERGMTNVVAEYRLLDDGTVEVINTGLREGKEHRAMGHAKTSDDVGRLRVSFFWKFYSDYNIMEMAEDGSWVLVGSRSPNYLWILSRTPKLPQETLNRIVELARKRGYKVEELIYAE